MGDYEMELLEELYEEMEFCKRWGDYENASYIKEQIESIVNSDKRTDKQ